jgi:hypothetical protein
MRQLMGQQPSDLQGELLTEHKLFPISAGVSGPGT